MTSSASMGTESDIELSPKVDEGDPIRQMLMCVCVPPTPGGKHFSTCAKMMIGFSEYTMLHWQDNNKLNVMIFLHMLP